MIFKQEYEALKPKATIIIVHGIGEHSDRYLDLKDYFIKNNFNVVMYDHIGHGRSGGKKGKLKSFKDNIEVLHNIVIETKEKYQTKIFLLGHSMGGGVVNLYGVTYNDVDGIISSSAATNTPSNMKIFRVIGFSYLRFLRVNTKIFKNDLAKDKEVYLKTKDDPLMLKYMYLSLLGEMFVKGAKYIHKNIENFVTPVFYIHGTSDKIVDYRFSEQMFSLIKSEDKEIKLYEGEYHEMLNDFNKEIIKEDILNWLEKRV